jgi:chromosome segregation ATPase
MGLLPCAMLAQTAPGKAAPAAAASPCPVTSAPAATGSSLDDSSDRFGALREAADNLKCLYEQLDTKNMAEVDQLLRTKRCQINRIGGDLDRVLDLMHQWLAAEEKYWDVWSEGEQKRIDNQVKDLAGFEEDQKRASDLVEEEKQSREELQRRRAQLESGPRTEGIKAEIDGIVKDIQDSEARLSTAQQTFEDLTTKITNMKAAISARVVDMRQNKARLGAFDVDMTAYYEKNREAANEICNTKQPDTQRTPLPKKPAQ